MRDDVKTADLDQRLKRLEIEVKKMSRAISEMKVALTKTNQALAEILTVLRPEERQSEQRLEPIEEAPEASSSHD